MCQDFDSLFNNVERRHYQKRTEASQVPLQVMIWPTFSGLSDFEKQFADRLAEQGYAVTAIDLYGQGQNPHDFVAKQAKMGALLAEAESLHDLQQELTQQALQGDSPIVHIGFCLGGRLALEAGLHFADVIGAASFHGVMSFYRAQSLEQANQKVKLMIMNGYQDPLVSDEDAQSAKQYWSSLGIDFQFFDFGNTVHSFMLPSANNPGQASLFNPLVAKRGFTYLTHFLAELH
ncbi:dienelactone hydrolase family protein [Marinomonas sp. TW1]|uniref:dienelactone hydrolase family protein n=1 Tax=Marinomonas sp. TW1 TaxID=1561203 RepID=UPI0007AF454D|nr:alpha/beta fold hydrolase [Marinomonas sp. TW1]KZN12721.1 dienelactone hydrolase [Marinomonas sp. TW1]